MQDSIGPIRFFLEKLFARFNLGMRAKLISLFVVIKVLPLVLLALVAWTQSERLGSEVQEHAENLIEYSHEALNETATVAIDDAVKALDARAREDLERMTTDTALLLADFFVCKRR